MSREASLIEIANCGNDQRAADILFVHGLDGDPRSTWMADRPPVGLFRRFWQWIGATQREPQASTSFWPEWLASDFPQVGIWTLGYPAVSTAWRGTAMALPDRARQVLQLMHLRGIGQRQLIFIVHSLGGLLVKQLLRTAHTQNNPEWARISTATIGILFLATPHSGASLATFVDLFRVITRRNWTIRDLAVHEPHLRDLNEWFRSNFDGLGLRAHVLCESQPVCGVMVVNPVSADPGIAPVRVIPVDKNHINICKPTSRDDQVFLETRQFISDCVRSALHRADSRQGSASTAFPTQPMPISSKSQPTPSAAQVFDSSEPPLELSFVTIGILTVLSEEYAACKGIFDPDRTGTERDFLANNGRLTCWVCRINARFGGQHLVAIARAPDTGSNSGAIAASLLLQCCPEMRYLILCGIAGAVPHPQKPEDHVRLGDIVVSNRDGVIQYDFGKQRDARSPEPVSDQNSLAIPFQGFELRSPPRAPSPHLLDAVGRMHADEEHLGPKDRREWEKKVDEYLRSSRDPAKWKRPPASMDKLIDTPTSQGTETPHPKDDLRRSLVPRVFHGRIGAGNIVLADPVRRNYLRDTLKIKAVEMEASGFADASWVASIGYLVVRGTCDYCNSTKNDIWHRYAALIAGAYTRSVVEYLHARTASRSQPTASDMLVPSKPPTTAAVNQSLLSQPLQSSQLPREQHPVSALPTTQAVPASSLTPSAQLPSSAILGQVAERNPQALAPDLSQVNRVANLVDQLQTLLKAGRYRACDPLASELESLLQSLPRRGSQIRDGWIMLARLEDNRLHMAKQEHQEIDTGRLCGLYQEAENVID